MAGKKWRFINQAQPNEVVEIFDQTSAETLARMLELDGKQNWVMQEERTLGGFVVPAPTPVVPTTQAETVAEKSVAEKPVAEKPVAEEPKKSRPRSFIETDMDSFEPMVESSFQMDSVPAPVSEGPLAGATDTVTMPDQPSISLVKAPPSPPKPKVAADGPERRQQARFATEFKVILVAGSSSFRTVSRDISLGGMKLKEKIPKSFLNRKCIAYISHKDLPENIEVICEIVGDPSDPCRVKFNAPEPWRLKRLQEWIAERNPGARVA